MRWSCSVLGSHLSALGVTGMAAIEEEGRTLDEAVGKALQRIGLPRSEVQVEVLEERRRLFGLLGRPYVKIRVTYDTRSVRMRVATDTLQSIMVRMGIEGHIEGVERNGDLYLNISTGDSALLIGRRGRTIDALQYLINRMVNKAPGDTVHIMLDIEHYQERREDRLKRLAKRMAAQVKSTGRTAVMASLNAHERRIIHVALQEDKEVSTSSKGEGALREVLISPRRMERRPSREAQA